MDSRRATQDVLTEPVLARGLFLMMWVICTERKISLLFVVPSRGAGLRLEDEVIVTVLQISALKPRFLVLASLSPLRNSYAYPIKIIGF